MKRCTLHSTNISIISMLPSLRAQESVRAFFSNTAKAASSAISKKTMLCRVCKVSKLWACFTIITHKSHGNTTLCTTDMVNAELRNDIAWSSDPSLCIDFNVKQRLCFRSKSKLVVVIDHVCAFFRRQSFAQTSHACNVGWSTDDRTMFLVIITLFYSGAEDQDMHGYPLPGISDVMAQNVGKVRAACQGFAAQPWGEWLYSMRILLMGFVWIPHARVGKGYEKRRKEDNCYSCIRELKIPFYSFRIALATICHCDYVFRCFWFVI